MQLVPGVGFVQVAEVNVSRETSQRSGALSSETPFGGPLPWSGGTLTVEQNIGNTHMEREREREREREGERNARGAYLKDPERPLFGACR